MVPDGTGTIGAQLLVGAARQALADALGWELDERGAAQAAARVLAAMHRQLRGQTRPASHQ